MRSTIVLVLLCLSAAAASSEQFIRTQAPPLLSYEDLVELGARQGVVPELASRKEELLGTPFLSNEAYFQGVRTRPTRSPELGPFLRVAFWNIERGLRLDTIRQVYRGPVQFRQILHTQRWSPSAPEYHAALEEARILGEANILVINEADLGMRRTGYRDVVKELAQAAGMNYAFGVEFIEVDPVLLGTEPFEGFPEEKRAALRGEMAVDPARYRGLHGTAILSRYPIRSAVIKRFSHQPYDWFEDEQKSVAIVEQGKRQVGEKVFLEKVTRQMRRGGRMMLLADLEVPELPEGVVTVVATHLENRCKPKDRRIQMEELLSVIQPYRNPVILAGDLNTTGGDQTPTSTKREITKRLESRQFWARQGVKFATGAGLLLDVAVGSVGFFRKHTDPTVRHIFIAAPNPEKKLFERIEEARFDDGFAFDFRGDRIRSANGRSGTLANSNQRDGKGFDSTYRVERTVAMAGKFKLDWIFVKSYLRDPRDEKGSYRFAPHFGRTLSTLNESLPGSISDHDPITVDLPLDEPDGIRLAAATSIEKEKQ